LRQKCADEHLHRSPSHFLVEATRSSEDGWWIQTFNTFT
jgi:hypothetical protein